MSLHYRCDVCENDCDGERFNLTLGGGDWDICSPECLKDILEIKSSAKTEIMEYWKAIELESQ